MAYDSRLADRVRDALKRHKGVSEIAMFGGLCFMLRGRMAVGVLQDELIVRLPKEEDAAVSREPHVRPMDITGRPMRGFHFVSRAGLRASTQLRRWIERCADYAATLPAKPERLRRRGAAAPSAWSSRASGSPSASPSASRVRRLRRTASPRPGPR